jgi:hypothetical protein
MWKVFGMILLIKHPKSSGKPVATPIALKLASNNYLAFSA